MTSGDSRPPPGRIPDASAGSGATLADPELSRLGPRASWRGRYVILRAHAEGGLGIVSLALDETLGRKVALKQMREELADNPHLRARFIREAEITGQLEHPGIIPLYSLGQDEQGRPYYAMKFVEGQTFEHAIADHHGSTAAKMSQRDLLGRFLEVCRAVAYAHSQGFIHRDLKPSNIMVGKFGETLILDWGLAKRIGSPAEVEASPPTAKPVGTPAYMSPEQADGRAQSMGPASDVYGLGAVLYQLMTGQPPYAAKSSKEVIERVVAGPPSRPSSVRAVPPALEALCLRAMSRESSLRPPALELAREVERWLADDSMNSYRSSPLDRAMRWARHHRTATTAAISALIAAVIALSIGTILVTREKNAKVAALGSEAQQRRLAEEREARLRRHLYAANMRDAIKAWQDGHGSRALELLDRQKPAPDEPDLRGFEWELLWRQMRDARVADLPTPSIVRAGLVFSRDGRSVLAGSKDHSVHEWDLASRALKRTLHGDGGDVASLAISPDGKRIAAGAVDGSILIWDAATGEVSARLTGHSGAVPGVSFSPDSAMLASCGEDGTLRLWRAGSAAADVVQIAPDALGSCTFMPDGKSVVIAGADGAVRFWDLAEKRKTTTLTVSKFRVGALAVSPEGSEILAAGSWVATTWDVASQRRLASFDHIGSVTGAAYSADGRLFVTCSAGGQINVWDRTSGRRRSFAFGGGGGSCALSPDGRWLAVSDGTRVLGLWDLAAPTNPQTLGDAAHPVCALGLSPDGSLAIAGTTTGMIEVWNLRAGSRSSQARAGDSAITALAMSRDGRLLGVGDAAGKFSIWDFNPLRQRTSTIAHQSAVDTIDLSRDASRAVTAGADHSVRSWDVMDARELALAKGAGTVAAFSPDGARVVTAGPTTLPAVRGAADLRAQAVLPGLAGGFSSVAFSPDGATVAIGATGSNSLLWNTANPAAATTRLETKLFTVTAIAYLNDGRRLVTSNPYRSIQFWDPSTGEECGEFDVDVAMESAIAVSSDQTTLGVVTRDQRMCIFRGR